MTTIGPQRLGGIVLTGLSLAWALGVLAFGAVDLADQVANHTVRITMWWAADQYRFTDTGGDGIGGAQPGGVAIAGSGGSVQTTVAGLSTAAVILHVAVSVATFVPQVILAASAYAVGRQIAAGRIFTRTTTHGIAIAAIALLVATIGTQLLAWADRAQVLTESGSAAFSRGFELDPFPVTAALVLLIFALAFSAGERLQHDTEGLV